MRIVIDTNVIVSAIFFGGLPRQLLELLISHQVDGYSSAPIIQEYKETVEELCSRYPNKPLRLPLAAIIAAMRIIRTTLRISVCRDPDDNKFIECAVDAKCLYIVSGDKDLLVLKRYEGIEIVTVAEFFDRYYLKK